MRLPRNPAPSLVALLLLLGAAVLGGQDPQVSPRTFRGATDLLMLDVSALDKDRRPVVDLTQSDFTVLVDGKPQPVVAFKAVTLPPPPSPAQAGAAPWLREVASDVATNVSPVGRVIAILIDDYAIGEARLGLAEIMEARRTAMTVVDALGPEDRAAVVFTSNRHTNQTFTTDRRLLRAAIENAVILPEPPQVDPGDQGHCDCGVCAIRAIDLVAQNLRSLPEQRKTMFYISAGSDVRPSQMTPGDGQIRKDACYAAKLLATDNAMRRAQLANVTIEAFDPTGLGEGRNGLSAQKGFLARPGTNTRGILEDTSKTRMDFLRAMADATGGHAIVNNNDMHLQVPAVLAESSAYYLLGVERPEPSTDGRFHGVQVRVNRRDVEVRTRKGYYDLTDKDRAVTATSLGAGPLTPLISGPMETAGIPLTVAAAPFATPDGQPTVVMALNVGQPDDVQPQAMPRTETVEMVASLYHPETADGKTSSVYARWTCRTSRARCRCRVWS